MKAVFLSCNQSMYDVVMDTMKDMGIRGFTGWEELMGCGSSLLWRMIRLRRSLLV